MSDLTDSLGWQYQREPEVDGKDARHLVTLEQDGMTWVGIRVWNTHEKRWQNGNEPERAKVKAFMPLPDIARRYWWAGVLQPETKRDQLARSTTKPEVAK